MSRPDWQVTRVSAAAQNGGIHIQGTNNVTGEAFAWNIAHYGLLWSYRERYGRFRGAAFEPGARARLAQLLRMARREARA